VSLFMRLVARNRPELAENQVDTGRIVNKRRMECVVSRPGGILLPFPCRTESRREGTRGERMESKARLPRQVACQNSPKVDSPDSTLVVEALERAHKEISSSLDDQWTFPRAALSSFCSGLRKAREEFASNSHEVLIPVPTEGKCS